MIIAFLALALIANVLLLVIVIKSRRAARQARERAAGLRALAHAHAERAGAWQAQAVASHNNVIANQQAAAAWEREARHWRTLYDAERASRAARQNGRGCN